MRVRSGHKRADGGKRPGRAPSPRRLWRVGGRRWAGAAVLLLAVVLLPRTAHAVVPSVLGPIQALIILLPQLILALGALVVAVFKPRTYRVLFAYLWAHKALTGGLVAAGALLVWLPGRLSGREISEERTGAAWSAFRGGHERRGVVHGSQGPVDDPRVLWTFTGDAAGRVRAVDSSPAVVANRVYVGVSNQSPFSKSGELRCLDAVTGRSVWKYTGKGELDPKLRPVFSSQAVGADGAESEARYLVCGEGYHYDSNCRVICLDLDPPEPDRDSPAGRTFKPRGPAPAGRTFKPRGPAPAGRTFKPRGPAPTLRWFVQTTSHVESSPCIHEGKVYIGAGDDGLWCMDLETGEVLWRLEGVPFYEVLDGPRTAELAGMVGKTVAVTGRGERPWSAGDGALSWLLLDVEAFEEGANPASLPSGPGRPLERTVIGRLVRLGPDAERPIGASDLRIEVGAHYPDVESSPVAVRIPADPADPDAQ